MNDKFTEKTDALKRNPRDKILLNSYTVEMTNVKISFSNEAQNATTLRENLKNNTEQGNPSNHHCVTLRGLT